jgi:hypothetical protein
MICMDMKDRGTLEITEIMDPDRVGLISMMLRIYLNISLSKIPSMMTSFKDSLAEKRRKTIPHQV